MKLGIISGLARAALFAAGLLAASFAAQADVTVYRTMDFAQVGPDAYEITCYVEYSGIDSSHSFAINLFGGVNEFVDATYPYGAEVGPTNRRVKLSDPSGLWDFTAVLRKGKLTATRVIYLNAALPLDQNISSYCQGGALDYTTYTHFRSFIMYDYFRPVS